MAELIASLVGLRSEFNAVAPHRDKGADGWIGDANHSPSSDHSPDEDSDVLRDHDADPKNEVHALDIDSSGPWPAGVTFKSLVMKVVEGEKAKWADPNDMCRLNYVIFDRKIYDKDNDFEPRNYTGSDPHTGHAHFSARYETQAENDTRPWGVQGMGRKKTMIVYKGDEGEEVRFHQYLLNRVMAAGLVIDGVYGDKMHAAVNKYRDLYGGGADADMITGWMFYHMLGLYAAQYGGVPGPPGKDGADGQDGRDGVDGVFTGTLLITGGTLTAVDAGEGGA